MSHLADFAAYAAAFEQAFTSDDWSDVESYFTEDASYVVALPAPFGGHFEGRAAVLAYLKRVLDDLDRRFAERHVEVLGEPRDEGDQVQVRARVRYTAADVPELAFELEEIASFDGARIAHLEDRYAATDLETISRYVREHGPRLGIPPLV